MSSLGDKIRKSREFKHEVCGITLVCRRPNRAEWQQLCVKGATILDIAKDFVIDWEGATEATFVRSGSSDPIDFDRDAWHEWLSDNPDLWKVGEAIQQSYVDEISKMEDREKN